MFFYNGRFVDAIVKTGLDVISKVQSNACLLVPFTGTQKKGRGRPRKYVGRFDQNDTNQYLIFYFSIKGVLAYPF